MNSCSIQITDISLQLSEVSNELRGLIDDEPVYFRVPYGFALFSAADIFIAVALLEAMYTGRNINVDRSAPVSSMLLKRLPEIQSVYACWNSKLRVIDVNAEQSLEVDLGGCNIGSFYSGGVDSAHTLMRHLDEISHLVMLNCFDYENDEPVWQKRVAQQTDYAGTLGKQFLPVETNARQWTTERKISWEFVHGLILAAMGGVLGMQRLYIPSSHNYNQLFPWGTHPLTDPMWSTESTQVIHDGAHCSRGDKIRELIQGDFSENLQVCWKTTGKNCGECSKCIRTMVAFYLLGAETKSLPALDDLSKLKVMKPEDDGLSSMLDDMILLAEEVGNQDVSRRLRRLDRRYQFDRFFSLVDDYFFSSMLKRLHHKIRKPDWLSWRITLKG